MNVLQRGVRSVLRKPIKSIILLFIVIVMSGLFLGAMASRSASIYTQDATRQAIGATFRIEGNEENRRKRLDQAMDVLGDREGSYGGFGDMVIDFVRLDNDPYFASSSDWYEASEMGGADSSVIKKRFMGFLGGNEEHAKELLDDMKIVGGMDGIQFETSMDGENLTIKIKYKMQYWFDFFDMGKIPIEQKITTRMWK